MLITCETMLKDVPNLLAICVAHLFQYLAAVPHLQASRAGYLVASAFP